MERERSVGLQKEMNHSGELVSTRKFENRTIEQTMCNAPLGREGLTMQSEKQKKEEGDKTLTFRLTAGGRESKSSPSGHCIIMVRKVNQSPRS